MLKQINVIPDFSFDSVNTVISLSQYDASYYDWIGESDQVTHTPCSDYVGGDQAHNNLPPYIAVYMWERTA